VIGMRTGVAEVGDSDLLPGRGAQDPVGIAWREPANSSTPVTCRMRSFSGTDSRPCKRSSTVTQRRV